MTNSSLVWALPTIVLAALVAAAPSLAMAAGRIHSVEMPKGGFGVPFTENRGQFVEGIAYSAPVPLGRISVTRDGAIDYILLGRDAEATPLSSVNALRERLYDLMWLNVGILRDAKGLTRALDKLEELSDELSDTGIGESAPAFNLTWHDWLNLESQILASRAIAAAALHRENSRGAHFREDFPDEGSLEGSCYTEVRLREDKIEVVERPVAFTRVRPGQSLFEGEAGRPPTAAASDGLGGTT